METGPYWVGDGNRAGRPGQRPKRMSFFEIFQPGARHQREERDRQRILVREQPIGAPGPLGIDLDSGTATFQMPAKFAGEDPDKGPESGHDAVEPA